MMSSKQNGTSTITTENGKHVEETKRNNKTFFSIAGDILNCTSLILNSVLTSAAILKFPDPSFYDPWWESHGFCVNQNPNRSISTEVLCFLFLMTSAVAVKFLLSSKRDVVLQEAEKDNVYALQRRMDTSFFANASHGGGHLFLYLLGGPPPALELKFTLAAIGNIIMLFFFWSSVLNSIVTTFTPQNAKIAAVIILTIQYVLNVPGELSFTFSQSVILFSGSVDQLLLKEKGFTYLAGAFSYFPLFCLYILEMTSCQNILAPWGGHSLYDFYLGLLPFLLYGAVRLYERSQGITVVVATKQQKSL